MTNHSLLFENGLRDPWKYVSEADCLNTMDSELRTENGIYLELTFPTIVLLKQGLFRHVKQYQTESDIKDLFRQPTKFYSIFYSSLIKDKNVVHARFLLTFVYVTCL